MSRAQILIMHPDASTRGLLGSMLQTLGHPIEEAASDRAAVRLLEQTSFGLIIAGTDPTDEDSLEFLSYVRRKHGRTSVVLLFTEAHPERMREALQRGATTVLRYPLPATSLRAAVAQVLGASDDSQNGLRSAVGNGHGDHLSGSNGGHSPAALLASVSVVKAPLTRLTSAGWNGLVGDDQNLRQALELAASIAPTCAPVLILGEPGTGKSLLAHALHDRGPNRTGAFIEIECADVSEAQLEVDLFGRRGPGPERPGRIAQASGGTLHLSEVSALSPTLQYRLLRLIQDGEYEPSGTTETCRADVRFVCSSCEDLARLAAQGSFRQDLYYRLGVVTLNVPPLRHRGEDIERLADHFRTRFARALNKEVIGFGPEALGLLRRHTWPGNIKELEHVIQRGVVLCRGGIIEPCHLDLHRREPTSHRSTSAHLRHRAPTHIQPLKEALEAPERQLILQALEALNWNRQETARVLDINRTTLYKKMKKYGLLFDEPAWVN